MKKLITICLVCALAATASQGTIIKYGYPIMAGNIYAAVAPNYLLGFAISIPLQMELTDVGIITRGSDSHVKVGIYSNSGGNPGTKLAQTNAYHLPANSDTLIPVTNPVTLNPGTYWFMAVHDDPGAQLGGPGNFNVPIKYVSFNYDNTLPETFPSPSTYNGIPTCYYLVQIPEPATICILGLGALSLIRRKK